MSVLKCGEERHLVRERAELTATEQEKIRSAAAQILAHPTFRSSERSTRLFRYLLDRALSDEADALKERRIGHEVFGREAGYDTAEDPIVRNAASDLRKRLRQYDAESVPELPVRILLAPGAYVLDFRFSDSQTATEPIGDIPVGSTRSQPFSTLVQPARETAASRGSRLPHWIAAVAVLACIFFAVAFAWERQQLKQSRIGVFGEDPLWKPMLGTGKEVFVCLGHAQPIRNEESAVDLGSAGLQRITVTDLKAYTNISGFLQLHGQAFQMRTDNQTTLLDLRDRPTVLIGIGNNQWAQRLTSNLRFRFDFSEADQKNPHRAVSVVDAEHPEAKGWRVELGNTESPALDYAIAGRLLDPVTGGIILYIAGAGPVGTQAASEFVTQSKFLQGMPARLKDPRTNIQIVLRTPIVGGIPGTPTIIATNIY